MESTGVAVPQTAVGALTPAFALLTSGLRLPRGLLGGSAWCLASGSALHSGHAPRGLVAVLALLEGWG